ncbi:MAG: hypothetical protein WA895_11245 [Streptosporangiaceae bacterium]
MSRAPRASASPKLNSRAAVASSLSSAPTTISRTSGRLPAAVKTTGHLARLARQRATEPSRSPESCPLPVPRVPVANSPASPVIAVSTWSA